MEGLGNHISKPQSYQLGVPHVATSMLRSVPYHPIKYV